MEDKKTPPQPRKDDGGKALKSFAKTIVKPSKATGRKLTNGERIAKNEWMNREGFYQISAYNFFHDVASEGITQTEAKEIFLEIAEDLLRLSQHYRVVANEP